MRNRLLLVLVCSLTASAFAGCLAESSSSGSGRPDAEITGVTGNAELTLTAAPRVLVTPAGHRVSEFWAASNPKDPSNSIVAFADFDEQHGIMGCAIAFTKDAGKTWSPGGVIKGLDGARFRPDPWVTFSPDGRGHLICMDTEQGLVHSSSDDGGSSWTPGHPLPVQGADKDALLASSDGSLHACVGANGKTTAGRSLTYFRSTDDGETWPHRVDFPSVPPYCSGIVETTNGIHLLWFNFQLTEGVVDPTYDVGTISSFDGGNTWEPPVLAGEWRSPPEGQWAGRFGSPTAFMSMPTLAANPDAATIVVAGESWSERDNRLEIKLSRTTDEGRSYDPLVSPVVPSMSCSACSQRHQTLGVDPAGNLGFQLQLQAPYELITEVWFYASADFGTKWSEPVRLAATTAPDSWHASPWMVPNPTSAVTTANYIAQNPDKGVGSAHMYAWTTLPLVAHTRSGGEYWAIAPSSGGYLALWIDWAEGDAPQLWSSNVQVRPLAALEGPS